MTKYPRALLPLRPASDATSLLLRRAFLNALRVALVPALGVASGCGESHHARDQGNDRFGDTRPDAGSAGGTADAGKVDGGGTTGPKLDLSGFSSVPCDPLTGLEITPPVDYLALRSAAFAGQFDVEGETGEACKTASDAAACQSALAATPTGLPDLDAGGGNPDAPGVLYLVTTRGDSVQQYTNADEVARLLKPIDTPEEAVLLGLFYGYDFDCKKVADGGMRSVADGFEIVGTKQTSDCSPIVTMRYKVHVSASGELVEEGSEVAYTSSSCVGRRPAGLAEQVVCGRGSLAEFFTQVAHLEAASVHAFRKLARELTALGAPRGLIAQARRAAREEVRHARRMARLAVRFGGEFVLPRVAESPLRNLHELALDNAVEGCVRETYGALFGMFQARKARDLEIRRVMAEVAQDETRHASLAYQIAAWVEPQLSQEQRVELHAAQLDAIAQLARQSAAPLDESLRVQAGVPDARESAQLIASLSASLWRQQAA